MKGNATIIVHCSDNPLTGERKYRFEWEGPTDGIVAVTEEVVNQKIIYQTPWSLVQIDADPSIKMTYWRRKEAK